MLVFYTDRFIPSRFDGMAYGPIIVIRPSHRNNTGLLAHEKEHVKQFFITLGFHGPLYLISKKYRAWAEAKAYAVQLKNGGNGTIDTYAQFMANNYNLGLTPEECKTLIEKYL